MGAKKIIVTTTINPPTEALQKFNEMEGWDLIVVGDIKTPPYNLMEWDYLDPAYQQAVYPKLSEAIGWNCIQRRNIGFVEAYRRGAEIIATVDDDNVPSPDWGKNLPGEEYRASEFVARGGVFDPLSAIGLKYTHRGFPLGADRHAHELPWVRPVTPDIIAGLWWGSPDIDAITRIYLNDPQIWNPSNFAVRYPFFSQTISPFNSQNTILTRKVLPYYFMYPGIGRYDDIWASYYVQMMGFKVAYDKVTVQQNRNEHDLFKDLEDEIFGYRNTPRLLAGEDVLPDVAKRAYAAYQETLGGFGNFK